jgi:Terminase small subunit
MNKLPVLPTIKQEKFAERVAAGYNHAAAARDAGYSVRSAAWQAYQLTKTPRVAARIAELRELGQNSPAIAILDSAGTPLFYIALASSSGAIGVTSPNQIELLGK